MRLRALAASATIVLAAAVGGFGVTTSAAHASPAADVLKQCAPSVADSGWSYDDTTWKNAVDGRESDQFVDPWIARGLRDDCAWQGYYTSDRYGINGFGSLKVTVSNDVFDAAAGDHQRITITVPDAVVATNGSSPAVGWGACFPGFKWYEPLVTTGCDPNGWAFPTETPGPALYRGELPYFPRPGGEMYYRPRSPGGDFTGYWTASIGDADPGFHLQHVGSDPCRGNATTCTYELDFDRDANGQLRVQQDMQVVLGLDVNLNGISGAGGISVAIPLEVIQTGGTASPTTPAPSSSAPAPSSAPAATTAPALGGGGGGAGTVPAKPVYKCPALPKKETVAAAKTLLRKNNFKAGDVVAPKAYPKADRKHRWVVTQFLVQTNARVKVHGKWTTVHRYRAVRAGTVLAKGTTLAMKVALQKA